MEHEECLRELRDGPPALIFHGLVEFHESEPKARGVIRPQEFRCKEHGISIWAIPTWKQIHKWNRELG